MWFGVDLDLMRKMLPLEAQAMGEGARRAGVRWADFTPIFDHAAGTTFNDLVHQTDLGNQIIAERLLAVIQPMPGP